MSVAQLLREHNSGFMKDAIISQPSLAQLMGSKRSFRAAWAQVRTNIYYRIYIKTDDHKS